LNNIFKEKYGLVRKINLSKGYCGDMQYTKTMGIELSKLTLGTAQLGLKYGIANKSGRPTVGRSFEILKTANQAGVNSFDTAESYGDSELLLGRYFSTVESKTGHPVIITKFKIMDDHLQTIDIEKVIRKHVEDSLHRLRMSVLPIYMLHHTKDLSLYGPVVLNTLKKLVRVGLVEKLGVSLYYTQDVDQILEHDAFEVVQIPLNIVDQRMITTGAINKMRKHNLIIFVRSVFLQGLFFMKPDELFGNLVGAVDMLSHLHRLAENEGLSVAQLALSFARDIEGVSSLVIGAETPEQVRENIALMDAPMITEKTRSNARKLFSGIPEVIICPPLWDKVDRGCPK
jgi:aryl-alcohol dehydrogenase-like predicted oxidoreductase